MKVEAVWGHVFVLWGLELVVASGLSFDFVLGSSTFPSCVNHDINKCRYVNNHLLR